MTISKPTLPPKVGYVEVEVDGVRVYRNVTTGELLRDEAPASTLEQRVAALEVQLKQTDDAAIELYEAQLEINAAQDDALIELYEMIGG